MGWHTLWKKTRQIGTTISESNVPTSFRRFYKSVTKRGAHHLDLEFISPLSLSLSLLRLLFSFLSRAPPEGSRICHLVQRRVFRPIIVRPSSSRSSPLFAFEKSFSFLSFRSGGRSRGPFDRTPIQNTDRKRRATFSRRMKMPRVSTGGRWRMQSFIRLKNRILTKSLTKKKKKNLR